MSPEKKKHAGGRPPKYTNPDDMQVKIDQYFDQDPDNITITGLAIALDMDRSSIVNYAEKTEYFPIIKAARSRIESMVEKRLLSGKINVAGLIFWLKNNAGWRDAQEININDVTPSRLRLEEQLANMGDAERRELLARELEKTGQFKRIAAA